MTDLYLDHVLIAVRDLSAAGRAFEGLGFKVTPEGRHPGRGTHNRLVVFGPEYLEIIAVHDPKEGLFRPNLVPFLESREGLFIFAMGSADIDARYAELKGSGVRTREPVPGARQAEDGATAYSWRQMEIDAAESPGSQTFVIHHDHTVEERYAEPPEPTAHPNGADGIHHLAVAVNDAEEAASRWQDRFGLAMVSEGPVDDTTRRVRLDLGNSYLDFLSPLTTGSLSRFLERNGEAPYHLAIRTRDLDATENHLAKLGLSTGRRSIDLDGASFLLDPADAQGVPLKFLLAAA
jgi:catechol 2,3-dioxygenase-like lactoylglutathione lyase family enzyme